MGKLRLGVILGGTSGEHTVSVASGVSVLRAADKDRYEISLVGISREGRWLHLDGEEELESPDDPGQAGIRQGVGRLISPVPGMKSFAYVDEEGNGLPGRLELDVVFPVLHGPGGEDGSVQGLLELLGLPYVGAGVVGSSVGVDKDVMKRLARDAGIDVTPFLVVRDRHWIHHVNATTDNVTAWCLKRGFPVFVKPACHGSSVGITRVDSVAGIGDALGTAFQHDRKVIVEKGVQGREIECAVLGGLEPEAAPALGEVIPADGDFYSYDAKYVDPSNALTQVPATVDEPLASRIRQIAVRSFRALECWGMARVDFFIEQETDQVIFNEINTIPGFTPISMFPKMWIASGLAYPVLINRLVDLALQRPVPGPLSNQSPPPRLPR